MWFPTNNGIKWKPLIVLGLVSLCTDLASEMLYPVTPLFLAGVVGASMLQIGLIEGLAEGLASLLKGYFGLFSDRIGKRAPFIIFGYTVSAFSKPIPAFFDSVQSVLSARLIDRLGKAVRTAPRDALLSSLGSTGSQGTVFGFHRALDTVGAVLGPLVALFALWLSPHNYRSIFILAFFPGLLASVLTFFVKDTHPKPPTNGVRPSFRTVFKTGGSEFRQLLLAAAIFQFFNGSDVFLILKLKETGASELGAIGGYVLYNFVYAALAYPLGRKSDTWGKRTTVILGLSLYIVVYIIFALAPSATFLWMGFVVYGVYAACSESIFKAWIADVISPELRGTAFGLFTALSSIGTLFASVLTGYLWDSYGSAIPFYVSAIGALTTIIFLPRTKREISSVP